MTAWCRSLSLDTTTTVRARAHPRFTPEIDKWIEGQRIDAGRLGRICLGEFSSSVIDRAIGGLVDAIRWNKRGVMSQNQEQTAGH